MIKYKHLKSLFNIPKLLKIIQALNKNKPFFSGYKRVYHHHLMKTGGTSINHMFLNLSKSSKDDNNLYEKLMTKKDKTIIENNWVYSAWNHALIALGLFHYAHSHRPIYKSQIPKNTFVFSCIRHPYSRIYSRYKHLLKDYNNGFPKIKRDYSVLGSSFVEYLNNIPTSEICHQLYMFSNNLNVEEAIIQLNNLTYIALIDELDEDISNINSVLKINLKSIHVRKNNIVEEIDLAKNFETIHKKIAPELDFYRKALAVRKIKVRKLK